MAILSFPKNPAWLPRTTSPETRPPSPVHLAAFVLFNAALLTPAASVLAQAPAAVPATPAAAPEAAPAAAADPKLWTRPVAPASWTVTFRYGQTVTPQQAAHRPTMVKVTVLGKDALETIQYPNRTAEIWRTEGHVIMSEAGSDHASIRMDQGQGNFAGLGGNSDLIKDVARGKNGQFTATVNGVFITGTDAVEEPDWAEFKEFDWVKPELLKGKIEISGEKLLVYADMEPEPQQTPAAAAAGKGRAPAPAAAAQKYPPGPLGGLPLKPGIRVAAIEEISKNPRYLQMGENIQIYAFSKPEQTKLELPPKITSLVAKPAAAPEGAKPVSLIP
jgi:hypothetical protein